MPILLYTYIGTEWLSGWMMGDGSQFSHLWNKTSLISQTGQRLCFSNILTPLLSFGFPKDHSLDRVCLVTVSAVIYYYYYCYYYYTGNC